MNNEVFLVDPLQKTILAEQFEEFADVLTNNTKLIIDKSNLYLTRSFSLNEMKWSKKKRVEFSAIHCHNAFYVDFVEFSKVLSCFDLFLY